MTANIPPMPPTAIIAGHAPACRPSGSEPIALRLQNPQEVAQVINDFLGFPEPQGGTRENGWFAGYGCRWCNASRAWFTVLPFSHAPAGEGLVRLFTGAGLTDVSTGYEGGIGPDDGGRGIQVSAYL